jgi:hypothetical protein|tara:strand:- start:144 stop:716 length:573 start_codon:yes stop_codon:yes gene_type:complete
MNSDLGVSSVLEDIDELFGSFSDDKLGTVSALARSQLRLHEQVLASDAETKRLKEELRAIQEDLLPAAMTELGLHSVELRDGSKVSVKTFYGASINKETTEAAFDWLNGEGFGDLIKNVVTASFSRGEENGAQLLADELEGSGHRVSTKKWVEPMTLKAFVREQVEGGHDLPQDLFNVFIGEKASITRKG